MIIWIFVMGDESELSWRPLGPNQKIRLVCVFFWFNPYMYCTSMYCYLNMWSLILSKCILSSIRDQTSDVIKLEWTIRASAAVLVGWSQTQQTSEGKIDEQ